MKSEEGESDQNAKHGTKISSVLSLPPKHKQ